MSAARRWLPVAALLAALAAALVVAASPEPDQRPEARVERIAREVRCPTCQGLSAWESDAAAAKAVKQFVRDRVDAGATDRQVKAELKERFGADILLRPEARGVAALVWALPAAAGVAAAAALGFAFQRWRSRALRPATDADRVLVERARLGRRA